MDEDSSDLDNELDELLQGLESGSKLESKSQPVQKPQSKDKPIEEKIVSSKPPIPSKPNLAKSVRFSQDIPSDEDAEASSIFKKQSSSSMLQNMFFADPKPTTQIQTNTNLESSTTQNKISQPPAKKSAGLDDWLGLGSSNDDHKFELEPEVPKKPKASEQKKSTLDFMSDQEFTLPWGSSPDDNNKTLKKSPEMPIKSIQLAEQSKKSTEIPQKSVDPPKSASSSLVDALPFLLNRQRADEPSKGQETEECGAGGDFQQSQPQGKVIKKKTVVKSLTGTTLQIASHLVNEDELKAMSSSLKALYDHQLGLQQQSYKEQLEFYAQVSKRKEEWMREEYEERIASLKAELNAKDPQKFGETLIAKLEELQNQFQLQQNQSLSALNGNDAELKQLMSSLKGEILGKIDGQSSSVEFKEVSKELQSSIQRVLTSQSNLKSEITESLLDSVTRAESFSQRKQEKGSSHVKELRKELRRLYSELEGKNDLIHKSQQNMESEQRSLVQSIRDLITLLNLTKGQNQSLSAENEMELKLLQKERHSLSKSIAEMNVELRKLGEAKLDLAQEKMEFEREKIRSRENEGISKQRLEEAEQLKREAESLRQKEKLLLAESESRLAELSKEKRSLKQRAFELETGFRSKEQKLYLEKAEMLREKEFLSRLKDQLLCPGCLNTLTSRSVNYGELNYGGQGQGSRHRPEGVDSKISHILTSDEKAYFLK